MTNPVPAQPPATPGAVTEDRRKHFDFIQTAVSRWSACACIRKAEGATRVAISAESSQLP